MRVNIWRAAVELTWDFFFFFLERSKFPAVTELPSPAALIKTAAEPEKRKREDIGSRSAQIARAQGGGCSYSLFCV